MKWIYVFVCFSTGIAVFSCRKPSQDIELVVHQTEAAARGEMVIAEIIGAPANARIGWSLSPISEHVQPSPDGRMARVLLNCACYKEYTINAVVYPYSDSSSINFSKTITAKSDEYFTIPSSLPANEVQPMTGDRLLLMPLFDYADSSLIFYARTTHSYECFNAYIVPENINISNGGIKATFNKVWAPGNSKGPEMPAQALLFTKQYFKDGTYTIDITFNNKLYQGTLEVSKYAKQFAFHWPHTDVNFFKLRSLFYDHEGFGRWLRYNL